MTAKFPSMTDHVRKITECPQFNDPRVAVNSHQFCVGCSKKPVKEDSCPLCQTLFQIPDDGFEGLPSHYFKEKLSELHQSYGERRLNLIGEKRFDTPLVEQFGIPRVEEQNVKLAWLENQIYVVHSGIPRVRVFSDRAPFEELEGIEVRELDTPFGIEACSANRALFINDFHQGCIFKIQMPNKELTRWDIGLERKPMTISITPNMELLVAVHCYIVDLDDGDDSVDDYDDDDDDDDDEEEDDDEEDDDDDFSDVDDDDDDDEDVEIFCARLLFFKPTDGSLTRSMRLPRGNWFVYNAFELPNKTFVYSVRTSGSDVIQIGVPSEDGECLSVIRTLNLEPFESIKDKQWLPSYFTVSDDGLFFTDIGGRIIWFDSKLTDYRIISSNDLQLDNPNFIEYVKDKHQLLVYGNVSLFSDEGTVSVFHLSPCSLARERAKP